MLHRTRTLFCYVSDVGASLLGQNDDVRCLAPYVRHLSQFAINVHSSGYGFTLGVRAFEAWLYTFMSHKSH